MIKGEVLGYRYEQRGLTSFRNEKKLVFNFFVGLKRCHYDFVVMRENERFVVWFHPAFDADSFLLIDAGTLDVAIEEMALFVDEHGVDA